MTFYNREPKVDYMIQVMRFFSVRINLVVHLGQNRLSIKNLSLSEADITNLMLRDSSHVT